MILGDSWCSPAVESFPSFSSSIRNLNVSISFANFFSQIHCSMGSLNLRRQLYYYVVVVVGGGGVSVFLVVDGVVDGGDATAPGGGVVPRHRSKRPIPP